MSLSSAAVAQAAALPPPVLVHRSVVIVAAGGRDLSWPQQRIASALLQRTGGRPVHLLLHGGARGADRSIGRAAQQLGWRASPSPLIGAVMAALPGQSAIASCWSRPWWRPRPTPPRHSVPRCW